MKKLSSFIKPAAKRQKASDERPKITGREITRILEHRPLRCKKDVSTMKIILTSPYNLG